MAYHEPLTARLAAQLMDARLHAERHNDPDLIACLTAISANIERWEVDLARAVSILRTGEERPYHARKRRAVARTFGQAA